MKLYISADMEGTAAVCSWTQVDPSNATEYPYYRRLMSREVRAAIDGAREAGVTDVLINDSHSAMRNVLWDELPTDVRMIYGNRKPLSMSKGIDGSFDAAFFTGYHAGVGEQNGVLDRTYTSETLYNTRVNGVRCNEAMLNAAAIEYAARAKPFVFEPPIELEVDFVARHNADFAELIPGFERTGGRSVRFVHDDFRTLFKAYVAAFRLGASANAPV